MNESDRSSLRRQARAAGVSPAALNSALECGLFDDDDTPERWAAELRQMRRMMADLGVNAAGAALMVRLHRDMRAMQRRLQRLDRLEARWFESWDEGIWRDLMS